MGNHNSCLQKFRWKAKYIYKVVSLITKAIHLSIDRHVNTNIHICMHIYCIFILLYSCVIHIHTDTNLCVHNRCISACIYITHKHVIKWIYNPCRTEQGKYSHFWMRLTTCIVIYLFNKHLACLLSVRCYLRYQKYKYRSDGLPLKNLI